MTRRTMIIGMSIRGLGYHPAAWRHPDVPADGTMRFEHYVRNAQAAERGKCDLIFFADGIGVRERDIPQGSLPRLGYELVEMEPMTLLPALAVVTKNIGLVTTASTTYNEPYNLARKFATLDHISNGRAGWNVVTSWSDAEAKNFGREDQLDYDTRYPRAAEFVEVVRDLWDSWEDDAFLFDKSGAQFYDPTKLHTLDHNGRFFSVRGPLNVARPPQGHPVIVQAGASEQGRELAAATADIVYAIHGTKAVAQAFYADIKRRMPAYDRKAGELKILPAIRPVVGRTEVEAQAKFDQLQSLLDPMVGLNRLSNAFGDLSGYPLDGPVPLDHLGPAELRSISKGLIERVRGDQPTIRQLYQDVAGKGGFCVIGTPKQIADIMQDWFDSAACDGFNITPTHLPGGCEDFVELLAPELKSRGLMQSEYQGRTLRENLGLKPAVNRFTHRRDASTMK
ncbi:MAG: LLM class flavin-dependent oxidoreductase [Hyphomicrobiaceae bacterium]